MKSATALYYILLYVVIVLQRFPKENSPIESMLVAVCEYDSRVLCPECFSMSPMCHNFDKLFLPHAESIFNKINSILNSHTTRMGTFLKPNNSAVLKHMNRENAMEKLLEEFCEIHSQPKQNCTSWKRNDSIEEAKAFIKDSILDTTRIEGCVFCPTSGNKQTLERFLATLKPEDNELWNLLAIRTNVEPLLLKLFSTRDTPWYVPKLLGTIGFSFIESYEGQTLEHFYEHPLTTRMLIASKLIKAAFRFTEGIHGFRFYLTDINPDNVVVHAENGGKNVRVTIVDLNNVIILDSLAKTFSTHRDSHHVHGRIECNGCFAYVQEDICRYPNSDLNLFATCQLLLENLNGNYAAGLLHNDQSNGLDQPMMSHRDNVAHILHNLLEECVYCQPPDCRNRSLILEDVLNIIDRTVLQL